MKLIDIKDTNTLAILKIFENDKTTKKTLLTFIDQAKNEKTLAKDLFNLASLKRPTNAALKKLVDTNWVPAIKVEPEVKKNEVAKKPVAKKVVPKKPVVTKKPVEVKKEVPKKPAALLPKKPEVKPEVKPPEVILPKPFTVGAFQKNLIGQPCQIIEFSKPSPNESYMNYYLKYLNCVTHEVIEIKDEIYYSNYHSTNIYFMLHNIKDGEDVSKFLKDSDATKPYNRERYLFPATIDYKFDVAKESILPGVKALKNNLSEFTSRINAIRTDIKSINEMIKLNPDLKDVVSINENLITTIKLNCIERTKCDIDGVLKINNQQYRPSLYALVDIINFCKEHSYFLTADGIMSLECFKNRDIAVRLKEPNYIKFVPEIHNQIFIMIKLCSEMDKIDSISETLKYSSNKEIYYKGLEKNVTGTFWFIYKKA